MANITKGYKSTEFWVSLAAMIVGALLASGVFADGGLAAKIIGGVASVLAALGYTASRASVKNTATLAASDEKIAAAATAAPLE